MPVIAAAAPIGAAIGGSSLLGPALIGGGLLGSALIGSNAARTASNQQSRAFQRAQDAMRPFMLPGQGAAAGLAGLYGINPTTGAFTGAMAPGAWEAFQNSPDFRAAMESIRNGQIGVQTTAAGQGLLRSGNTLRALTDYTMGRANEAFGNYRGSLERLAQIGAGAAGNIGQLMTGQGTAQASGTIGAANAWMGALGNMGNYFMLQNLMNPGGGAYKGNGATFSPGPMTGFFGGANYGGIGAQPY